MTTQLKKRHNQDDCCTTSVFVPRPQLVQDCCGDVLGTDNVNQNAQFLIFWGLLCELKTFIKECCAPFGVLGWQIYMV